MKLLTLLTVPLLATATIVYPSTTTNCGKSVGPISACGCTGLTKNNYNIQSARVDFQKATARFYEGEGCGGARISVASDKCFKMQFWDRVRSVRICGGTCKAC